MKAYTISILVNNKPGVLVRLSQTFARRGYNVESLVVSPAHDPEFSRLTVSVQGEPETFDQILKQLNKLIDVVYATHHIPSNAIDREMALFKIKATPQERIEVLQIIDVFRAKTIDITKESIVIEVTGNSEKIDAISRLLMAIGIIEVVRSGKLIMARGIERT